MSEKCSINGCEKPVKTRGWCQGHYLRFWRHGDPLSGGPSPGSTRKILEAAAVSTSDECIYLRGYSGRRYVNLGPGQVMPAARAVWTIANGDPGILHVLHTCHGGSGYAGCININHLYLGDHAQNMRDIANSGNWYRNNRIYTLVRGEKHHNSKLTDQDVREIRDLLAGRVMSIAAIGKAYGVSTTPIMNIKKGTRGSLKKLTNPLDKSDDLC